MPVEIPPDLKRAVEVTTPDKIITPRKMASVITDFVEANKQKLGITDVQLNDPEPNADTLFFQIMEKFCCEIILSDSPCELLSCYFDARCILENTLTYDYNLSWPDIIDIRDQIILNLHMSLKKGDTSLAERLYVNNDGFKALAIACKNYDKNNPDQFFKSINRLYFAIFNSLIKEKLGERDYTYFLSPLSLRFNLTPVFEFLMYKTVVAGSSVTPLISIIHTLLLTKHVIRERFTIELLNDVVTPQIQQRQVVTDLLKKIVSMADIKPALPEMNPDFSGLREIVFECLHKVIADETVTTETKTFALELLFTKQDLYVPIGIV